MSTIRDKDRAVSVGLIAELQGENTSLRFQVEKLTLALRHVSSGGGPSADGEEVKRLHAELANERARREKLEQLLDSMNGHRTTAVVSRSAIEAEIENLQRRLTETRLAMKPSAPLPVAHQPQPQPRPQFLQPQKAPYTHQTQSQFMQRQGAPYTEETERDDLTLIIRHLNEKKVAGRSEPQPWRQYPDDDETDVNLMGGHQVRDQGPQVKRRGGAKSSNVERLFAGLPTRSTSNQGRRR